MKEKILKIFLRFDPVSLYFPDANNWDEYLPEVNALMPLLPSCKSSKDVLKQVNTVMQHYFPGKFSDAQSKLFEEISMEIWRLLSRDK